jgi:DNA-binding response OmpR family regulator
MIVSRLQVDCPKNFSVIIVSATHDWDMRKENPCGADHYIDKPFDIENLGKQLLILP